MFKWLSQIFRSPKLTSQIPNVTMNYIYEAVKNHIEMKTNGALLITGSWGSGKTYYLKKVIFPKIKSDLHYTPIMVSLYGATDKNSIANKVFFA